MNIKIDKNVPIPENGIIKQYEQTVNKMKVGDSFEYPAKHYNNVSVCLRIFKGINKGAQFTSKGIEDHTKRRLWRIQ